MGFVDAVKAFFKNYVKFSGRASRSEFWWAVLFVIIVAIPLAILGGVMIGMSGADIPTSGSNIEMLMMPQMLPFTIFYLAVLIPMLSLYYRRFQDRNQPGWIAFIVFGLSLVGNFVPVLAIINFIIGVAVIINFCLRGTVGPNKYGPDPLGNNADVFS